MKKVNQTKFLFFFIIFTITFSIFVIPNAGATTIEDKKIRYDWLNIQLENDPDDNIEFSKGGLKLLDFENDGIYQLNDAKNQIIYKSRVTFGFEIVAYSDNDFYDIWTEINLDATAKFKFFTYEHGIFPLPYYSTPYYVTARTIDFGETFNSQDLMLNVPITIDITPDFANLDGQTINGLTIQSTEYVYQIKAVEVTDIQSGTCGDYEDKYTDQTYQEATVDIDQFIASSPSNPDALNVIREKNLGAIPGETREYTVQNSKIDTLPEGHTEINSDTGAYVFNEFISLRPEITKSVQEFEVREGILCYDDFWGVTQVFPVTIHEEDRVRSIHVYNQFVHKDYEVTVNLLATVQLDAEAYESFLSDPYLRYGDWLWDEEIGGTTEVTPVRNESAIEQIWTNIMSAIFGNIWTWILMIVGIIILVAVVLILYQRSKRRILYCK